MTDMLSEYLTKSQQSQRARRAREAAERGPKVCGIPECTRPRFKRSTCEVHYQRVHRGAALDGIYILRCRHCAQEYHARTLKGMYCNPKCRRRARYEHDRATGNIPKVKPRTPEQNREHNNIRRAARVGAESERFQAGEIYERDGWRCGICGRKITRQAGPEGPSLDHILPISAGGGHTRRNVRASHLRCNIARGARGAAQLRLLA